MYNLDIHLAKYNINPLWYRECSKSLEGIHGNIHEFDGVEGNIFKTRCMGFMKGTAPYVSYIDPDDIIHKDAIDHCTAFLDTHSEYSMVYTNSYILKNNNKTPLYSHNEWSKEWHLSVPLPIHQLVVIKRDIITEVINDINSNCHEYVINACKFSPEQLIYAHIVKCTNVKFLSKVFGYEWR